MLFNNKEFVELSIKNANHERNLNAVNEAKQMESYNKQYLDTQNIYELRESKLKIEREYKKFISDTKKSLLTECIYTLMDKACGYQSNQVQAAVIKRNLVDNYINEQGVNTLLSSFRTKTFMLSEFARIIEKYTNVIVEKADKNNPDTFVIDDEDRDNFFDELKFDDVEEVATAIKTRVSNSIDEFVNSNIKQKEELKEILTASKERIDNTNKEEVKESYELLARKAMTNIREKRVTNVFESMVFSLAQASLNNEELKKVYARDNKLDMDSIVENVTIMYSFLETLNSAQIHTVNESYIQEVLESLKK